MKIALPAIALGLLTPTLAASQDATQDQGAPPLLDRAPTFDSPVEDPFTSSPADCTDTIQHVREQRGLPPIERRAADPDEPILFKAVDHNVGGCDVLLVGDGDIRPLPEPREGEPLLRPAQ